MDEAASLNSPPGVGKTGLTDQTCLRPYSSNWHDPFFMPYRTTRPFQPVSRDASDTAPACRPARSLRSGAAPAIRTGGSMDFHGFGVSKEERYFEDYTPGAVHEFGEVTVGHDDIIAFGRQFDPQPWLK